MNITIDVLRELVREQLTGGVTPVVTTDVVSTEEAAEEKANAGIARLQAQYDTLKTRLDKIDADIARINAARNRAEETKEKASEEEAGEALKGVEAALG